MLLPSVLARAFIGVRMRAITMGALLWIGFVVAAAAQTYPDTPTPRPLDSQWVPMRYMAGSSIGVVRSSTVHNGDVVFSGGFDAIGRTRVHGAAAWNGTGFVGLGTAKLNQFGVVTSAHGVLYGASSSTSTALHNALFRWSGSDWDTVATANGIVSGVGSYLGGIAVVGRFTMIGGVAANHAAYFDGTTWSALGTGVPMLFNTTECEVLQVGSGLYALSGSVTGGLWSFDGSNWSQSAGLLLNGAIESIAVDGTDLLAAGRFTMAGPDSMRGVARWNGTQWTRVGIGSSSLQSFGVTAFAGRIFANVADGDDRICELVAGRWHGTGDASKTGGFIRLRTDGTRMIAWGTQPTLGPVCDIRVWSGTTWTPLVDSWGPDMTGSERALFSAAVVNDSLYVCGSQQTVANGTQELKTRWVSGWDGYHWFTLGNGLPTQPLTLENVGGQLYAAGTFTVTGGREIARWSGVDWLGFGTGYPLYAADMAMSGGSLYLAGDGGVYRFLNPGFEYPGAADRISSGGLTVCDWNSLPVAGGSFLATTTGRTLNRIARWDGLAWQSLNGGLNGVCEALTTEGGDLIAGGAFTTAGGVPARGVARWDGSVWHAFGTRAVEITGFTHMDGVLYACGAFQHDDGEITKTVARWEQGDWTLLGSGLGSWGVLSWVQGYRGDLYVGGDFGYAFGKTSASITYLPAANTLGVNDGARLPAIALSALPNPARGAMRLAFTMPIAGHARLTIHDVQGREVARLVDGEQSPGTHEAMWSSSAPPGLYFARLTTPQGTRSARLVRVE